MKIKEQDIALLRELGRRYMDYATLPVQKEKLRLWKTLNGGAMKRPMVAIDQLPWHELEVVAPEALTCKIQDPFWINIERDLRQNIYKWEHFPVDMVLEPFIKIHSAVSRSGYGVEVDEDVIELSRNETASSHHYRRVLKNEEDLVAIKNIEVTENRAESQARLEEANFIFEGIAPIHLSHGVQFHLGVWDTLARLIGIEEVFFELIDRPEFLYAAVRRITDATIAGIEAANKLKVHDDTINLCHCSYIYHDRMLPNFADGNGALSENCWSFGMAQLFTSVSPATFGEFELPFISEMAKYFGGIYYGCCEKLDDRLELVSKIPNIRKVSCSPWSDREKFAEKLDKKLIMSSKPTPAYLAVQNPDEDTMRKDIAYTCRLAKKNNINLELILKDISTIKKDPLRLCNWHKIVMEAMSTG